MHFQASASTPSGAGLFVYQTRFNKRAEFQGGHSVMLDMNLTPCLPNWVHMD